MRCQNCKKRIALGEDSWKAQSGVLGNRGFVALDDTDLLCSKDCLLKELTGAKGTELSERIP